MDTTAVKEAVDDLNEEQIEDMISDFLQEHNFTGEFLVWIEKWKSTHRVQA